MDEPTINSKMQQVVALVSSDISGIRTGKASSAIIESLEIMVYGGQQRMKINELGTITVPDAQTIVIDPWDKSIIGDIRKGLDLANIGLNPSIDGNIIRLTLPPLTTEDRDKYVKLLHTKLESGKIMIRQIRADFMHDIKKSFERPYRSITPSRVTVMS